MADYIIQPGDTLSKIAKQYGLSVKQLQDANGIKNENLIFAGKTIKIPDITNDDAFNIKGTFLEKGSTENDAAQFYRQFSSSIKPLYGVPVDTTPPPTDTIRESNPQTPSLPVEIKLLYGVPVDDTPTPTGVDSSTMPSMPSMPIEIKPLYGVPVDDTPTPTGVDSPTMPTTPTEPSEPADEMVCRDASGRTQNISGKFTTEGEDSKKPDKFVITDNSSGEDHVYTYEKIGEDENGKAIYTCVSMNGIALEDNQYTLEWLEDGSPELVQYDNQDNFGRGLRAKKE